MKKTFEPCPFCGYPIASSVLRCHHCSATGTIVTKPYPAGFIAAICAGFVVISTLLVLMVVGVDAWLQRPTDATREKGVRTGKTALVTTRR